MQVSALSFTLGGWSPPELGGRNLVENIVIRNEDQTVAFLSGQQILLMETDSAESGLNGPVLALHV